MSSVLSGVFRAVSLMVSNSEQILQNGGKKVHRSSVIFFFF